ncbi:MAG: trypsin-like peptidase domain-containing protein [Vicinamibacterales bacterium]
MTHRQVVFIASILATAVSSFTLGIIQARHADSLDRASYDARFDALRDELQHALARDAAAPVATMGLAESATAHASDTAEVARAEMVSQIKEQLRNEMGLLPVSLIRERQSSFVELYSYDSDGQKGYGTAGYLGGGYFITVKHAVVALGDAAAGSAGRKITTLKVVYKGKEIPAKLIDAGKAEMEVDSGDWAIIRTRELDLPPLRVDAAFSYEFADPIFRLGNDYSKGIVVSTGYVGQRTTGGLVTCLLDGHPGASGGGVLDKRGVLVGIPIGRMQGDYRFSFILPIRAEMMRKVPKAVAAQFAEAVTPAVDAH